MPFAVLRFKLQQPRRATAIAAAATAGLLRRVPCAPLCAVLAQRWASSSSTSGKLPEPPAAWRNLVSVEKVGNVYTALSKGKVDNLMGIIVNTFNEEPQPSGQCSQEERKMAAREDRPCNAWGKDRFRMVLRVLFLADDTRVIAEHSVNTGIADLTVEAGRYKYVFEVKVKELPTKDTAATALQQAKRYALPVSEVGFTRVAVGIVFSQWTRNVCDWASENMDTKEKLNIDPTDAKEIEQRIKTLKEKETEKKPRRKR